MIAFPETVCGIRCTFSCPERTGPENDAREQMGKKTGETQLEDTNFAAASLNVRSQTAELPGI
jgi:hypothetical protein